MAALSANKTATLEQLVAAIKQAVFNANIDANQTEALENLDTALTAYLIEDGLSPS